MKKIALGIIALLLVGGGVVAYVKFGGSSEVKRDQALKQAKEYLAESKVNQAIIEFRNALRADPGSAEAHYEFGMALLRHGDARAAYQELMRAVDLKPAFIKARYQFALLHVVNRDTKRATEELEQIRRQDKDAKEGYYLAAQIAMAQKQPDRALKELDAALNNEPDDASIYIDIGEVHAAKKDYHTAESAYRKALQIAPTFYRAGVALAQLYAATGKHEQAEQELLLVTKAEPENEDLLHVLGGFYSNTRRFADFEKVYQDLIRKKPDSIIAKKRLVEIYFAMNDRKQAKQHIDDILKAIPMTMMACSFVGAQFGR
jgi:tetratricopeptide (TPR) repeat protein